MKKNQTAKKPKAQADSDHHTKLSEAAQQAADMSAPNTPDYVRSDSNEQKDGS